MKATDYIAEFLYQREIDVCFELVGGMITHFLDSINKAKKIKIISCHHEQAAGFAAEGYGRITGKPGITFATSGPGATNLITAIASCYFDSTPALFITGQVNTFELSKDSNIRQLGFQETDIVSLTKSITKKSLQLEKVEDLPKIINELFDLTQSGRFGPCLLDIPMNLQAQTLDINPKSFYLKINSRSSKPSEKNKVKKLMEALSLSKKPLLLLGGGCSTSKNRAYIKKLINLLEIPAVCSLLGLDSISDEDKLKVGFIGSYGNRWANKALAECDLLIAIGSRLDIRQTGSNTESFSKNKEIWQIDIDNYELQNNRIKNKSSINLDINQFIIECEYLKESYISKIEKKIQWEKRINLLKLSYPIEKEYLIKDNSISPIKFLNLYSTLNKSETTYISDVGQHQMWAAQSLFLKRNDRFLTSGGMGAMGFGLPASIGAYFGDPEKKIVLICGDGGFQLNIQELETIKRNNLNITILIINNKCHGMVRQFQESYFKENYQSTIKGYSSPDFTKIAKAYGIKSKNLKKASDVKSSIEESFEIRNPYLLEIIISKKGNVYPKLAFGRKFGEMEPDINPIAMEST